MKLHKRVIALLLAVCMILPTCVTALADEPTLNYVALGDSMSQGYMFLDYNENSLQGPNWEEGHYCGWKGSSDNSYVKKFAKYLNDGFIGDVNFNDLTIQGLQPDEVYAFLKPDTFDFDSMTKGARKHIAWWTGDYTTEEEQSSDRYIFETFDDMSAYYIDAITNADVITFDIGENYFGTWLTDNHDENETYTNLMKNNAFYRKTSFLRMLLSSSAYLMSMDSSTIDRLMYACVSYVAYSESCITAIKDLNPDVQIILLPLVNPNKDLYVTINGVKISYSGLIDDLMDYLNDYMADESPCRNMYTIAEYDGDVISFADELYFYPDTLSKDAKVLLERAILGEGSLLGQAYYPAPDEAIALYESLCESTYNEYYYYLQEGWMTQEQFDEYYPGTIFTYAYYLMFEHDDAGELLKDENGKYYTKWNIIDRIVYEEIAEKYGEEVAFKDFFGNIYEYMSDVTMQTPISPCVYQVNCDTHGEKPGPKLLPSLLAEARAAVANETAPEWQQHIVEAVGNKVDTWEDLCLKAATYRTIPYELMSTKDFEFDIDRVIEILDNPDSATDDELLMLHLGIRNGNAARGFGAHPCPRGLEVKYRAVVKAFDENIREKIDGMMNTLTIHYVKADGNEAAPDYTEKVEIGESYKVDSPVITDFIPDVATVAGVMGKGNVEVTVTYKNPAEGECLVAKKVDLAEGKYNLYLGGKDMGEFTFTKDGEYWIIQDEDGKYLWSSGSSLSRRTNACDWKYNNGCFSISVRSSGFWLFGRVTTYYLTCSNNKLTVSTSKNNATAEFYQMAEGGTHVEAAPKIENAHAATCCDYGSYDVVIYCKNCGEELTRTHYITEPTGDHVYGTPVHENVKAATCTAAGSYDEVTYCTTCGKESGRTHQTVKATGHTRGEAKVETIDGVKKLVTRCTTCKEILDAEEVAEGEITAKVSVKATTSRFLFFFTSTSYQVNITAESSIPGVTIKQVQYSTNGTRWTTGKSYSTSTKPGTVYVRVTDSAGGVTNFKYNYSTGSITKY
ncbi:MAG: MucBP domain-containing protein [Lachnospiraceae bacterium]|nr:MucBP domain-containing protein [Candidatus Minthocola equi]